MMNLTRSYGKYFITKQNKYRFTITISITRNDYVVEMVITTTTYR